MAKPRSIAVLLAAALGGWMGGGAAGGARAGGEAGNAAPMTPEGKVESRRVGKHVVLIRKVAADGGMVEATLYLPSELVRPQPGRATFGAGTHFAGRGD